MATALILLLLSSSRLKKTGRYSLPKSSVLPMMIRFLKNSVRLNSSLSVWTVLSKNLTALPVVMARKTALYTASLSGWPTITSYVLMKYLAAKSLWIKWNCWKALKICLASGNFSSISVNRQSWNSRTAKPLTVLRFRAGREKQPPEAPLLALPLMTHQNNATMLWIRRRKLTVLEFFAVGKTFRALFWCAVKGGVHCQ